MHRFDLELRVLLAFAFVNGVAESSLVPVLPTVQHYVVISPSSRNGIEIGDEFTLISDTMGRDDPTPAPPVSAAIVQVVKVTPYGSTAMILSQIQPVVKEGMPVRLTAKMP